MCQSRSPLNEEAGMLSRLRIPFTSPKKISFLAIMSLIACSIWPIAGPIDAQETHDVCDVLPKVSVPEADRPTLKEAYSVTIPLREPAPSGVPGIPPVTTYCNAVGLYYSNAPGHFQKARYCVFTQLGLIRGNASPAAIKQAQSAASGGATFPEDIDGMEGLVLAMLYGNGEGVTRNLPLAQQYFCQNAGGIQGEEPAKLLAAFTQTIQVGRHFDVCDHDGAPFGRSVNYECLALQQDKEDEEIHRREASILATATLPVKASFLDLRSSWQAFQKAYGAMVESGCGGGTGCGVYNEGDDVSFTAGWNANLLGIQQGKAPASGVDASTFAQLDHTLNVKYQGGLRDADCDPDNCLATKIRDADRAWLKYREAWVQFGASRWPQIPADQWRAWQTAEWTALLSGN